MALGSGHRVRGIFGEQGGAEAGESWEIVVV